MSFAVLVALGICFAYGVLLKGGVDWTEWSRTLFAVGIAGCVHFLWTLRPRPSWERNPALDRIAGFSAAAFLCCVALQLVPLPLSLVREISPKRAELQDALLPILGSGGSPALTGSVTLSAVPHATAQYLLTTSAYVLVFLLVRDLSLRLAKWPWAPVWPLLIVVGLEAGLGLMQVNGGREGAFATGTYASRDHFAGLIEMVLPFPVMYAAAAMRRDTNPNRFDSPAAPALKASFLAAIAAVMLVAIVLSLSRMGFLSALASLLVAGVAAVSLRRSNVPDAAPWRKWLPTAVVILTVMIGFFFLPTNSLLARFADMNDTSDVTPDTRIQIWREAAGLVKDYPLFGCGMGSFESCFLKYKSVAPMSTVDYAHNDYLQVLAEAGAFGFLAGLLFVSRVFQRTLRAIFRSPGVDERYLAGACVASMTAILLHSFVDFNMYVPANGMLFAWVAGIAGVHLIRRQAAAPAIP